MRKNTRDKILDTTIDLLWRQSYGSVSVDDICKAAGIQKGSFYHYFPSKVDVVIAAFEKLWQDKRPVYDSIFSASLSPLERLTQYCDLAYEWQKEAVVKHGMVLGCPYSSCGCELSTQEERVRQKMNEMFAKASRYFESMMRDAIAEGLTQPCDPVITAQEMLCYVSGVMYQAKVKNDVDIIQRDLKPGLMRYFTSASSAVNPLAVDRTVNTPQLESTQ